MGGSSGLYVHHVHHTVASNLPKGSYTITGKFFSDDQLNVHSSGAGTARGWLANNAAITTSKSNGILFDVISPYRAVNIKDSLGKPTSDVDFAGYLFLSSTNKSLAAAVRYNNPQETIRRGKGNKNPDAAKAFLQHRDAAIVKVYNRPYAPATALAVGTVDRFSGDFIYTQGTGLFDQLSL